MECFRFLFRTTTLNGYLQYLWRCRLPNYPLPRQVPLPLVIERDFDRSGRVVAECWGRDLLRKRGVAAFDSWPSLRPRSQIRTSFVLLLRQTDHLAVKGDLLVLRFGRADGSAWRTIRGSLPSHLSLGRKTKTRKSVVSSGSEEAKRIPAVSPCISDSLIRVEDQKWHGTFCQMIAGGKTGLATANHDCIHMLYSFFTTHH